MTPEERIVRSFESTLRDYDAAKARDAATPVPWWLTAPVEQMRESVAAWRAEHPRTAP